MTWNNIKLETVTPIHIGNGEEYTFLDYFVEGNLANILDVGSVFEGLRDVELISRLSKDIEEKIINGQAQINLKEFFRVYGIDVSEHVIKKIKTDVSDSERVKIKKLINQNGRCYVPGSSIKGALRTAYIFDYFDKHIEELVNLLKDNKINEINKINDDIFKDLLVSDSGFIEEQKMSIIKTVRYNNKKDEKSKIPIYLEVLDADESLDFRIKVNKEFGKTIDNLKEDIIKLSKTVSDYEKNNPENIEFIKEFYSYISDDIDTNKTVYMNVGFGGGYLPKTIYLLLWKHGEDLNLIKRFLNTRDDRRRGWRQKVNTFYEFPRTKTIYSEEPIGWVKLNFSENER